MCSKSTRNMIIQLRSGGKTFQEISDILNKKYNINISRQSVYNIYKNSTLNKRETKIEKELKSSICRLHILGATNNNILKLLKDKYNELTLNYIESVINDNIHLINKIKQEIIDNISNELDNNTPIVDIINKISYLGYKPKKNIVDKLILYVGYKKINESCKYTLLQLLLLTDNKNVTKDIIKHFNLDITYSEISKAVKENTNGL